MSKKLLELIEKAKRTAMTPAELLEQEIGFAYGNVHYENERVTRDMVIQALPLVADGRLNPVSTS